MFFTCTKEKMPELSLSPRKSLEPPQRSTVFHKKNILLSYRQRPICLTVTSLRYDTYYHCVPPRTNIVLSDRQRRSCLTVTSVRYRTYYCIPPKQIFLLVHAKRSCLTVTSLRCGTYLLLTYFSICSRLSFSVTLLLSGLLLCAYAFGVLNLELYFLTGHPFSLVCVLHTGNFRLLIIYFPLSYLFYSFARWSVQYTFLLLKYCVDTIHFTLHVCKAYRKYSFVKFTDLSRAILSTNAMWYTFYLSTVSSCCSSSELNSWNT